MSATRRDGGSTSDQASPVHARFERFELDEVNASFLRDGRPVPLAPTPFKVLCELARQPGSLLTKNALLDRVWGHQFVSESVLKTVISELRTALGDDARQPRFIATVSRRGYRFVASLSGAAPREADLRDALVPAGAPLIGRGDALARLHAIWALARGGKRSVAWVAGEPGIGKTTLIEYFVASLGDVVCIRGQCVEQHGGGEPYLPVLEALSELCRRDDTTASLLRSVAPTWLLQLPWLCSAEERDALRRELAGVGADRALREMGEFVDRYTEQRPLLLVTEDLHWSDRATIQLIDYIARRRGPARFMWLATFRLAEVVALDHPLNPLRRELRLHRLCDEIVLDPFTGAEVAEYLARRAPSVAADEAFVRALQERTDGLPLFIASVVSELAAPSAQDHEGTAPAAQVARMAVPENLAAIIDRYIAKLGDEDRALLAAAAASGVDFRVDTVAAALGREVASVEQACDRLQREALWLSAARGDERAPSPEPVYSFRHALFRQVLYERTAPFHRAELHRCVGAALERERARGASIAAAELAAHFERGREWLKAAQYGAEAAEAALLRFSPAECRALADRGLSLLELVPAGSERSAAEFALATLSGVAALHLLGFSSAEAKAALSRAHAVLHEVPRHRLRGWLVHSLGITLVTRAEYDEALAMAERSAALSSESGDPALQVGVCFVQADVHMLQGRPRDARTWFERGLSEIALLDGSAEDMFLADPQVTLLALLAVQLLHLGLVESGRARVREARARASEGAQPLARLTAAWFEAVFEVRLGDAERVGELAREMQAMVEEFALVQGRTAAAWFLGWSRARLGAPLEGYELIRDAYDANTRLGMLSGSSETLGYAAEALLLAGDLDGARRELDRALEFSAKFDERIYLPQLLLIDAAIARGRGDSGRAGEAVREAIAEARQQGASWFELLASVQLCEYGIAGPGDRDALRTLVDRLPEASGTPLFQKAHAALRTSART